jgi:4-carboxymuconolactone decarboxylase
MYPRKVAILSGAPGGSLFYLCPCARVTFPSLSYQALAPATIRKGDEEPKPIVGERYWPNLPKDEAMTQRMPPLPPEALTPSQKEAADQFLAHRGYPVFGPFDPLLRSPELMTRAADFGAYLRYKSVLGTKLTEFAILILAREWSQSYEWAHHHPIALKAGLRPEIADALREGREPAGMSEDEEALYRFAIELSRTRQVSDAVYARAVERLGEAGVIDLIAIQGYYTFIAMILNVARVSLPEGAQPLPSITA